MCIAYAGAIATAAIKGPDPAPIPPQASDRFNVLLISVDDMNDWIGALGGHPQTRTPQIDRLAAEGMVFANAHAAAPLCNPSRAALLLGRAPSATGIYGNGQWWRPVLPQAVSLPALFRAHGYWTAGAGKLYHHTPGYNPPDQWDEYFDQVFDDPWTHDAYRLRMGYITHDQIADRPIWFPKNNLSGAFEPTYPNSFDWGPWSEDMRPMGDEQAVSWAEDFLKREFDRPFFLGVGIYKPHLPWYAPGEFFDWFADEAIVLPEYRPDDLSDVPTEGRRMAETRGEDFDLILRSGQYRDAVKAYLAAISYADSLVGRLVDGLRRSSHWDNTLIVLLSDHGWHLGEKHHWHKSTLWERATRVPLIIRAPGMTGSGVASHEAVSLIDVYPTLAELCGIEPDPQIDGQSLVGLLRDPKSRRAEPAVTTHGRGNHAVRDERWRYIRYIDGGEELYDHETDPNEWVNLATNPQFDAVKADLARWIPASDAPEASGPEHLEFHPANYSWSFKNQ